MGGTYAENNTLEVEVTDCNQQTANHVMWHYANWRLWGKEEDLLAWRGLSGYYGKEEIIQERQLLAAKKGGNANIESGHIQKLGRRYGTQAMSEDGWLYERRSEFGALSGKKAFELGLGIHGMDKVKLGKKLYAEGKCLASRSPGKHSEDSRKGGKAVGSQNATKNNQQRWCCSVCGNFESNARGVNRHLHDCHQVDKSHKHKVE